MMSSTVRLQRPLVWPIFAWICVGLTGFAGPAFAMIWLAQMPNSAQFDQTAGSMLAVGVMGAGMIGAAAARRFWIGILLASLAGLSLTSFALTLGLSSPTHPLLLALALGIASVSFSVRGALFAISAQDKGWWIAIFVVAGEAALLLTALAQPGALPVWLLVLLPAQWTNMGIEAAFAGSGILSVSAALLALAGTAAATGLVARLWPRRWPYVIMFSTWLALSALVYDQFPPA